ncbi:flavin-containing monooxygenase [Mariniluteicoccus flavus]
MTGRTVVIGAGPGGLAAAAALKKRGVDVVVVERADAVGSTWRGHYDRLRLHTPRELSGLPGYPIPKRFGRWVGRADVVRYLEEYAAYHDLDVRTGVTVERVERDVPNWVVRLAGGEELRARDVVIATGYNNTPKMPTWPGLDEFGGEVVHASAYRTGAAYAGRDVLVIGIGNTGAEIAVDLVEQGAGKVWIGVRTPPYILRRDRGFWTANHMGIAVRHLPPKVFDWLQAKMPPETPDLSRHGLPPGRDGLYSQVLKGTIPVQDVGIVAAVKAGTVTPVATPARFDAAGVELFDGRRLEPDVVVVAAGYQRALEGLVGHLGVLNAQGSPIVNGGKPALPGLWFSGFTNPISGMFRELRIDAEKIAKAIAKGLPG